MARAYSLDLRERVVGLVAGGSLQSCKRCPTVGASPDQQIIRVNCSRCNTGRFQKIRARLTRLGLAVVALTPSAVIKPE